METRKIGNQKINVHHYNTVIVGSGAAGMNCAVHLFEFMEQNKVGNPQERIAVVTAGIGLGASRMSGSDKQTYYKTGTSPEICDSAEEFAKTLTAAGCCHGDLALAEAIGSLREFYHLVRAGVPFPHDPMGTYCGYKTDNDPYERATSAGPKTSRFMSECLEKQVRRYGIQIHDRQEVAHLLTLGAGNAKQIAAVVTIDKSKLAESNLPINVFYCANLVLAAGGPGELYKTTVYPKGQIGIHGLALKAGLTTENLTESQFGLASIKFRWNVSGSFCQAIPRIFSTDADGKDQREFLTDFFPSMSKMASNIFLKGYQWPFDPQRISDHQSSLIDILVFREGQKGRHVFMDFLHNPLGSDLMKPFDIDELEPEAAGYLKKTGALQATPIERLAQMNPPAIEIYKENGIDLYSAPLEIAVCAQHNNGGFAVNKWWQSNIGRTFVIGEMAGTHGVKRPGGAALNAGQVGGLRAAEYIVNAPGCDPPDYSNAQSEIDRQLTELATKLQDQKNSSGLVTEKVIDQIRNRMTASAGHIRELEDARIALAQAVKLYKDIQKQGFKLENKKNIVSAIQAEHLALASAAFLKAIVELLEQGGGSRGSYLVLADDGTEIHPDIYNKTPGKTLKFKPENERLRNSILQIEYDPAEPDLFRCRSIKPRQAPALSRAFELAWRDYREGKIYGP
jgi:succinate dehydrogenase/fumarate reductase flavoprotein subunit